ncbi:MAG: SRPBCC family protein [Chloroflexi bacterium]|nr:SRPBCC family protein [Chloroflexota bacterium]
MKNVLDHRILIPRSPQTVWQYLSDVSNNPHWQTDCESVSFLTSRRSGVGTRWRYRTPAGHDCVVETTAWYDGLGYEYTYIDGVPFEENRGRIRLQEIPEGTVVQWTFSYDTRGFLSGVRNSLTLRRQIEKVMMDSLRSLWKKLNQAGLGEPIREAKSLIREAPDYEERSRYKPRHPSKLELETAAPVLPAAPIVSEPPLTEEDTRPSARVSLPAEPAGETADVLAADVHREAEPSAGEFAAPVGEPPTTPAEAASAPVSETLPEAAAPPVSEPPPEAAVPATVAETPSLEAALAPEPEPPPVEAAPVSETAVPDEPHVEPEAPPAQPMADAVKTPQPVTPAVPAHAEATTVHEQPSDEAEADRSAETVKTPAVEASVVDATNAPTRAMVREPIPPEKLAAIDTREVSVFDIFGLPKPSETQEHLPAVPSVEVKPEAPVMRRVGLRLLLRRKLVKLRRPA